MKTNKRTVRKLTAVAVKRIREELEPIEDKLADLVSEIVYEVVDELAPDEAGEAYSEAVLKQLSAAVKVKIKQ